ncbi:hypothetical protein INR77_08775 [Erythrobacter sp. SCSIO 43205]|uniref:hypothetical protein n=1 Tax=Erythrobacter sp. SCSIO 43205 TaxID=2779361 RepID=UPI001CA896C6|nr:hypothetical protein [Erythrobacter sp. SCSIO 43205]UAB76940.1 hypothetical protein INR77_08775 [Erythrobacter sp. SCSIO 43205]
MTLWKSLMLIGLALFVWQMREQLFSRDMLRALGSPQLRTWLALMGASLSSQALFHFFGVYTISSFIALDLAAAVIILLSPKTGWQTVIGSISGVMGMVCLGFMVGMGLDLQENISASPQQVTLYAFLSTMGLVQALVYITWGGWQYVGDWITDILRSRFPVFGLHRQSGDSS